MIPLPPRRAGEARGADPQGIAPRAPTSIQRARSAALRKGHPHQDDPKASGKRCSAGSPRAGGSAGVPTAGLRSTEDVCASSRGPAGRGSRARRGSAGSRRGSRCYVRAFCGAAEGAEGPVQGHAAEQGRVSGCRLR